jgi:hypothetical protein
MTVEATIAWGASVSESSHIGVGRIVMTLVTSYGAMLIIQYVLFIRLFLSLYMYRLLLALMLSLCCGGSV